MMTSTAVDRVLVPVKSIPPEPVQQDCTTSLKGRLKGSHYIQKVPEL